MGYFGTEAGQGALAGGIGSILNFGLGLVASNQIKQNAKAEANAVRDSNMTALEVARINQQTELAKLEAMKAKPPSSNNTMLYVGLGVGGVVLLGVVIFAVTRK